jgi:hypothetical protein
LFGWLPAVLFSHINSTLAISHLPANSIFLSQQISTSHQPSASRTRPKPLKVNDANQEK